MSESLQDKAKRKGLVWVGGVGPTNAKIVIVGESLGAEEERLGAPFVGGAGFLLDSILRGVGLDRVDVYITNVIKVRPPNNELEKLPELGLTISEFIPLLREELERVKPNVVVALGNPALEALTSEKSIMKWRGSILESSLIPGLKVLPSVHPAAILRQYKWRPFLALDMKKVVEESKSREINLPERNLMIEPSFIEVQDIIDNIYKKYEKVSFDIEVDKAWGKLSCISLSPSSKWAISIPFRKAYASYWMEGEELVVWKWLEKLFQSDKHQFIVQNGLFDLMWLVSRIGYFPIYMDTMWAAQTCYAELPKGLDTLASIYTREPYYKDERKVWKDTSITKQLWLYNAKDAVVTYEVAIKLEKELEQLKLSNFFFGFVMKLMPVLLKLQMRGIRVDLEKREEIRRELLKRKEEIESVLNVNVRSSKQLSEFLYGELGLPKQYHRKTGAVTTNKEALIKLRRKVR